MTTGASDWTRADLEMMADIAAEEYGLPTAGFRALVARESGWDPDATSSAGAVGLTQLMAPTAADLGVLDRRDPADSLLGGARYLRQLFDRYGDPEPALAAYNWGMGNVDRARRDWGAAWLLHAPAETRAYVSALGPPFGGAGAPSNTGSGWGIAALLLLVVVAS